MSVTQCTAVDLVPEALDVYGASHPGAPRAVCTRSVCGQLTLQGVAENPPGAKVFCEDICDFLTALQNKRAGHPSSGRRDGVVRILMGGPPCQVRCARAPTCDEGVGFAAWGDLAWRACCVQGFSGANHVDSGKAARNVLVAAFFATLEVLQWDYAVMGERARACMAVEGRAGACADVPRPYARRECGGAAAHRRHAAAHHPVCCQASACREGCTEVATPQQPAMPTCPPPLGCAHAALATRCAWAC